MLKNKRKEKNLTQSELSEKIGISEGHMNKLENHPEHCNPSINLILKISRELGLHPVKIFYFFIRNKL